MHPGMSYVNKGIRTGGLIGAGIGGAALGGLSAAGKKDIDEQGHEHARTTGQRIARGVIGGATGAYLGHAIGGTAGGVHHILKWDKGYRPRPSVPDWLKGAKTKNEARRAYHAQARKAHPDIHGGSDAHIKDLNSQWEAHEPHFKTAQLAALADELLKIAMSKGAVMGALLGGTAGWALSPNSIKGKVIGTAGGALAGSLAENALGAGKRALIDDPRAQRQAELYGYQPNQLPSQGSNFY